MMNDVICPCCFSAASLFETYGLPMFHNWLLAHKCLLAQNITDNFISHKRQRPINFASYCQFCHTLSKYSYIHNFSDEPLATRISENIHKVRWETSRYANFPSITPPQVLCRPRGGGGWDLHSSYIPYFVSFHTSILLYRFYVGSWGWEDFYVENTFHTFKISRPYKFPCCHVKMNNILSFKSWTLFAFIVTPWGRVGGFLDFRKNYAFPVLEPRKKALRRTTINIFKGCVRN